MPCSAWHLCQRDAILLPLSHLSSNSLLHHFSFLVHCAEEIEALCQNKTCKAGRECRVLSSGIPECVCLSSCPRNKGRPICGSDGLLYKSHCDLHRQACLKGNNFFRRVRKSIMTYRYLFIYLLIKILSRNALGRLK